MEDFNARYKEIEVNGNFIKIDLGMKGEENDLNENRKLKGNGKSRDR